MCNVAIEDKRANPDCTLEYHTSFSAFIPVQATEGQNAVDRFFVLPSRATPKSRSTVDHGRVLQQDLGANGQHQGYENLNAWFGCCW